MLCRANGAPAGPNTGVPPSSQRPRCLGVALLGWAFALCGPTGRVPRFRGGDGGGGGSAAIGKSDSGGGGGALDLRTPAVFSVAGGGALDLRTPAVFSVAGGSGRLALLAAQNGREGLRSARANAGGGEGSPQPSPGGGKAECLSVAVAAGAADPGGDMERSADGRSPQSPQAVAGCEVGAGPGAATGCLPSNSVEIVSVKSGSDSDSESSSESSLWSASTVPISRSPVQFPASPNSKPPPPPSRVEPSGLVFRWASVKPQFLPAAQRAAEEAVARLNEALFVRHCEGDCGVVLTERGKILPELGEEGRRRAQRFQPLTSIERQLIVGAVVLAELLVLTRAKVAPYGCSRDFDGAFSSVCSNSPCRVVSGACGAGGAGCLMQQFTPEQSWDRVALPALRVFASGAFADHGGLVEKRLRDIWFDIIQCREGGRGGRGRHARGRVGRGSSIRSRSHGRRLRGDRWAVADCGSETDSLSAVDCADSLAAPGSAVELFLFLTLHTEHGEFDRAWRRHTFTGADAPAWAEAVAADFLARLCGALSKPPPLAKREVAGSNPAAAFSRKSPAAETRSATVKLAQPRAGAELGTTPAGTLAEAVAGAGLADGPHARAFLQAVAAVSVATDGCDVGGGADGDANADGGGTGRPVNGGTRESVRGGTGISVGGGGGVGEGPVDGVQGATTSGASCGAGSPQSPPSPGGAISPAAPLDSATLLQAIFARWDGVFGAAAGMLACMLQRAAETPDGGRSGAPPRTEQDEVNLAAVASAAATAAVRAAAAAADGTAVPNGSRAAAKRRAAVGSSCVDAVAAAVAAVVPPVRWFDLLALPVLQAFPGPSSISAAQMDILRFAWSAAVMLASPATLPGGDAAAGRGVKRRGSCPESGPSPAKKAAADAAPAAGGKSPLSVKPKDEWKELYFETAARSGGGR